AGVGAGVQFRGLDLGAEDGGHRRGDHDGHGELVAQAAGEVDAVPAEVGGVDDAVVGDAAGGGHADGGERAVEAGGEAVEAGHDVLDEVGFGEFGDGGGHVGVADGASAGVEEPDVGGRRADGDARVQCRVVGQLERDRRAAAALGAGEVGALVDESRTDQGGDGAGDGGLGQAGGLHELAARDDLVQSHQVEAFRRR